MPWLNILTDKKGYVPPTLEIMRACKHSLSCLTHEKQVKEAEGQVLYAEDKLSEAQDTAKVMKEARDRAEANVLFLTKQLTDCDQRIVDLQNEVFHFSVSSLLSLLERPLYCRTVSSLFEETSRPSKQSHGPAVMQERKADVASVLYSPDGCHLAWLCWSKGERTPKPKPDLETLHSCQYRVLK